MATQINKPIPTFEDLDGTPLEDGYIYIGDPGLDPATNPITVYSDASLSTTVTQPVRTTAGRPYVSGSPVRLYVAETDWSLRVSNKNNTTVEQDLNAGANQGTAGAIAFSDGSASAPSIIVMRACFILIDLATLLCALREWVVAAGKQLSRARRAHHSSAREVFHLADTPQE